MVVSILLAIMSVVLIAIYIITAFYKAGDAGFGESPAPYVMEFTFKKFGWALILGALLCAVLASSVYMVDAGEVAAVKRFGAVVDQDPVEPGLHLRIPIADKVVKYSTKQAVYETSDNPDASDATYTDYSVTTMTKDGQRISVRFTLVFHVDSDKAGYIVQNIGTMEDVVTKVVQPNARSEGRNIPKLFRAEELYSEGVYKAQAEFEKRLTPVFAAQGLVLDEFRLRDVAFDQALEAALERKQIALEDQVTAERQIQVKAAEANQAIEAARGRAQSRIIEAESESKAIRLVNKELEDAPAYSQYLVSKGLSEGTTGVEWGVLPPNITSFFYAPNGVPTNK